MRPLTIAIAAALFTSSCARVAPVQVTPQPEAELARAPLEKPVVPPADPAAAQVPEGYRVEVVVRDLTYPSSVEVDAAGNLYVAEAGFIYGDFAAPTRVLRVQPDGRIFTVADQRDGLQGPITDLLLHDGRLYVAHKGKVSVVEEVGRERVRDLVTGLPSLGDHYNNQLAAGPDGKIYFGQGTATNSGVVGVDNAVFGWLAAHPQVRDVPARDIEIDAKPYVSANPIALTRTGKPIAVRTSPFHRFGDSGNETIQGAADAKANGTILRMNPDGSGLEVFAWGLRNPYGVLFAPDGTLYASDNGYDNRGSRPIENAPDVLWQVRQGAWYGWPDFAGGVPVTDARFRPSNKRSPEFLMKSHPPVERAWAELSPHAGACKVDFAPAGFGEAHAGQMFLAQIGDMTPVTGEQDERVGFNVVRVDLASRKVEPFFAARADNLGPRHMEYTQTAGPRRPVDVRFAPDGGAMYVVDLGAILLLPTQAPTIQPYEQTGVIWRVVREGADVKGPPANLSPAPPTTQSVARSD